ncbi:hypothetical protein ACF0H5_008188 [Mactra antiquata]
MAWHKQKQYDPSEAFIQNERQQKLLNIQLQKIDKLWLHQLRLFARDRLETTSELLRLEDEKGSLEYFDDSMDVHKIKEYTDNVVTQMKAIKKEMMHDNYNFDNTGAIVSKKVSQMHLNLPKVDELGYIVTQSLKPNGSKNKPKKAALKRRRKSNLFKSRILSVSDSNLDRVSKYKRENAQTDFKENEDNDTIKGHSAKSGSRKHVSETNTKIDGKLLPSISSPKPVLRNNEQHRYLKEKMATALVLPTVNEAMPRQRKLSV